MASKSMIAPVSIVIPVLNEKATLPALFKGLEKQTLTPAEIIFINAGSTDGSMEMISAWFKSNTSNGIKQRIISKPGTLPGAARNAGIELSEQEWIAFLDVGVVPDPNWLNALFNYVREHEVKSAFGICQFIGEGIIERTVCALSYGYKAACSVLPASLFHRNVFKEVGLFNPGLRSAEDIHWINKYLKIYSQKEICKEATVTYNNFPDSIFKAIKKWYVYGLNTVKAGVLQKQQFIYFFIFGVFAIYLLYKPSLGLFMLTAYAIARGGIVPMGRSRSWHWWKGQPVSCVIAVFLGILLDMAKTIGFIVGHLKKLIKKIR